MPRAAFPIGGKSLLLPALAALFIGGVWWWTGPPREPEYQGQQLSEWLAARELKPLEVDRFAAPIQAFGPGAIPWLNHTLQYGKHPFIQHGPLPLEHAPEWVRRWLPARWGGLQISSSLNERLGAARALGEIGPEAAPAIPALAKSLADETVEKAAAIALHKIGPASWPAVEDALEHGNLATRKDLAELMSIRLGALGADAPEAEVAHAITALMKACHDHDPQVRVEAANAIGACYSRRPEFTLFDRAIPEIIRLLSDPDEHVRGCAVATLGSIGPKAAAAIPRMFQLLETESAPAAAWTLSNIDTAEKRSATRLRTMLRHPAISYQEAAARALRALGLARDEKIGGKDSNAP